MKLAIMQPYIFPYVGYFQLISSVDKFVIYDDVAFINRGWVNRNRILLSGKDHLFSVPLKEASQNKLISETYLHTDLYVSWKEKFYKLLEAAYKRAPFYNTAIELIKEILESSPLLISELAERSIKYTCEYVGVTTTFVDTSTIYNNSHLRSAERILDICKQEGADGYINAMGGKELYNADFFKRMGIDLKFLKPHLQPYQQYKNDFVPGLSVIDLLMFNSAEQVNDLFSNSTLID